MSVSRVPDSASKTIAPNGADGDTVKLFALDGNILGLTSVFPTFITADEAVMAGDAHAVAEGSKHFGTGGFLEQDLTVQSAAVTVNAANFDTPGLGVTTQALLPSPHNQWIKATAPDTLIVSGTGNDTLVGMSGTNILDGGSGVNTYYGGTGQNTFIADARTASASAIIENMKSGDNLIIAGNFASLSEGTTPGGLDFQIAGLTGSPSAEVVLSKVTSTAGLQVGFDTHNAVGANFFFIHMN